MTSKTTTFFALGTVNSIEVFDGRKAGAVREAAERVFEINGRMSAFLPDSDLSRIGRTAGEGFRRVHPDTFRLLQRAVEFGNLTEGAFDITVRPLADLWGINRKGDFVPSEAEIREALKLVDYRSVRLDRGSQSCRLEKKGQAIDLGGIAKGFAADEVKRILTENGVGSALINLGGNIAAVGSRPDGSPWTVGIQNPLAPRGESIGYLSVRDKTVVTSGCNERFFIKNGVRYHHILDPRTGRPVQNSLLSVTAVCSCSADADALTTALFILGPGKSVPLIRKFGIEAVFIFKDLSAAMTPGLKGRITFEKESQSV